MINILIVDEEPDLLDALKILLKDENFHVQTAIDSKAALSAIKNKCPDLLIADLMMPGMRGLELLQVIRNDSEASRMKIILMSASKLPLARAVTWDTFILKPFDFEKLHLEIIKLTREQL